MSGEKLINNKLERVSDTDEDLEIVIHPQIIALNQNLRPNQVTILENDSLREAEEVTSNNKLSDSLASLVSDLKLTRQKFEDLRKEIIDVKDSLVRDKERIGEILGDIQDAKNSTDTQNILVPVHAESLENVRNNINEDSFGLASELETLENNTILIQGSNEIYPAEKTILEIGSLEEENEVADSNNLSNYLASLAADLKLTRKKVNNFKNEVIYLTDTFVKDEQRMELSDEIQAKQTTIHTQNNLVEIHEESLDNLKNCRNESSFRLTPGGFEILENKEILAQNFMKAYPVKEKSLEIGSLQKDDEVNDVKVLRNEIEILVAGLKLTRQKTEDLKKESCVKNSLVKDIFATEKILIEAKTKLSKIEKPIGMELVTSKMEYERNRQKIKDISAHLGNIFTLLQNM